jgi:hypothetical protein
MSIASDPDTSIGSVGKISQLLDDWLALDSWQVDELLRLLNGNDLPAVGSTEEPYVWISRALFTGASRAEREKRLAARLGRLIDEQPDVNLPGARPEQILFNLLSLCAEMNRPDELSEPLRRMFERRLLAGEWDGLLLRGRLRAALASNQSDWRLDPIWRAMARGDAHEFLPGNRYHGLDGILLMPPKDGEPPVDSIGAALGAISRNLESSPQREEILAGLLKRAARVTSGGTSLVVNLHWPAYESPWPTWAVGTLGAVDKTVYSIVSSDRDFPDQLPAGPDLPKGQRRENAAHVLAFLIAGLWNRNRRVAQSAARMHSRKLRERKIGAVIPA